MKTQNSIDGSQTQSSNLNNNIIVIISYKICPCEPRVTIRKDRIGFYFT